MRWLLIDDGIARDGALERDGVFWLEPQRGLKLLDLPAPIDGHIVQIDRAVGEFERYRERPAAAAAIENRQQHVLGIAAVGTHLEGDVRLLDADGAEIGLRKG